MLQPIQQCQQQQVPVWEILGLMQLSDFQQRREEKKKGPEKDQGTKRTNNDFSIQLKTPKPA